MKKLALCMLVLVGACSKKEDKAAPPAPEPKPVAPAPTPAPEPPKPEPAADCVVKLDITADKVKFDGGGITGEVARKAGEPVDLSKLNPLAGKCVANINAAPETSYQDVVTVMDTLNRTGVKDIWLGDGTKPPPAPPALEPSVTGEVKPDGSLVPTFTKPTDLKKMPVIVLTKTEATVFGKSVGKVTDPKLGESIGKALPPKPANPTVIVQADQSLTYATISAAVKAANDGGYTNVLFAVKNK